MKNEILQIVLFFVTFLVAALLIYWWGRKRWRLWRIIQSGDSAQVETARDWVTPRLAPYLTKKYWHASDWSKKRIIVELLQDQSHPDLDRLMLDFLRVPLEPGDEPTELAQAIALGFIDEKYDRFMEYYNDRELLAQDVRAALGAHGLWAEPPPANPPPPPAKPAAPVSQDLLPGQRLINGVYYNDLPMVQQSLREKANINTTLQNGTFKGCSALMYAVMAERFEIAQFLIEQGANIHSTRPDLQGQLIPGRGQTALHAAAYLGHLPLVKELLARGANIDAPDHFDGTPLTHAASFGQLEVVRYLVEQGADLHARISDGRNAFHLAVSKGHLPVVEYLLEAGNDPNEPCGSGFTPLLVAAMNNFHELAERLIQRGADVNAIHAGNGHYIGMRGYTPLVFSVSAGSLRMIKLFIRSGANIHYRVPAGKNWDGKRLPERGLLDFAKGRRGEKITELLRQHGLEK